MSDSLRPHELQHPGLPVHHQLPEFTQTHVHPVGDAIQSSHPFSSCPQSFPASGSFPMLTLFLLEQLSVWPLDGSIYYVLTLNFFFFSPSLGCSASFNIGSGKD